LTDTHLRGDATPAVGQLAEVSVREVIDMDGCGDEEVRCRATPLEHLGLKLPVHGTTLRPHDLQRMRNRGRRHSLPRVLVMKVHKAVIAAAGLGTRMFPITKTIDKAMLPIGSRPAIELIVGECRAAGVDQIAVVVRAGSSQVQDYYTPDPILESLLARHSWQSKGVVLNDIGRGIDFQFSINALMSMTTELQSHCSSSPTSSARSRSITFPATTSSSMPRPPRRCAISLNR
jgi:hypothetical protein